MRVLVGIHMRVSGSTWLLSPSIGCLSLGRGNLLVMTGTTKQRLQYGNHRTLITQAKSSTTVDLDFSADFASDFPSTLPSSGKLDQNGFPVSSATHTQVSTLIETRICAWCKKGGKDDIKFAKTLKLCSACKTTYYCR